MSDPSTFYSDNSASATTVSLVSYLLFAIGMIGMLRKAGLPAWGGFIPIYNIYLYIRLGGVTGVAILWLIVPIVNVIAFIYFSYRVSVAYGHGVLMTIFGLLLLFPIGDLILGFGKSTYRLRRFDTGRR